MTTSRESGGADVAAPPIGGCALFRKELASEQKHLKDLQRRASATRAQLALLEAAEHPNAQEVERLKAVLDRIEEDIDRTQGNIDSIQIDITMFCS